MAGPPPEDRLKAPWRPIVRKSLRSKVILITDDPSSWKAPGGLHIKGDHSFEYGGPTTEGGGTCHKPVVVFSQVQKSYLRMSIARRHISLP